MSVNFLVSLPEITNNSPIIHCKVGPTVASSLGVSLKAPTIRSISNTDEYRFLSKSKSYYKEYFYKITINSAFFKK